MISLFAEMIFPRIHINFIIHMLECFMMILLHKSITNLKKFPEKVCGVTKKESVMGKLFGIKYNLSNCFSKFYIYWRHMATTVIHGNLHKTTGVVTFRAKLLYILAQSAVDVKVLRCFLMAPFNIRYFLLTFHLLNASRR